ncbi:energy-coupling factor transporter ATPase [Gordonibacter sp. An230]|uniref:energy-coupling factor transporter ATPase n=1 Tax=Gordonibacter sp. An230 TaxID=1965592 RepID=UPI000B3A030C|nr:energy-coupling factor transporter ATPase [Gordonibacter sp. An230]OUO89682.1 energy-coupling factor transporter ATPase [Gordonibacter sp. An230]
MPIAFEGVSYAYVDPERQAKSARRRKRRRDAGAIEEAPSLEKGFPAWGGSPDAVWALADIDFTLADGEFLGVAGHTGSGKSTLVQHMNGLVHPTRGRVLFDGQDLADKRVAQECRGKVGLVFQYPEHQLFAATVREDVAFGPRNLGLSDEEIERRVRAALEDVHLDPDEVGGKSPFELSGGQQRRVAFAGVLAMEPRALVLDEPVAGLDPVAREEFLSLIEELHSAGLTVVMVSHSMDDLARLADRMLVLNEGRQFALGTPAEVFAHGDALRAIGLDVPAAQKLAEELREMGVELPRDLYDLESLADDLAGRLADSAPSREPKVGEDEPGRNASEAPCAAGEAPYA